MKPGGIPEDINDSVATEEKQEEKKPDKAIKSKKEHVSEEKPEELTKEPVLKMIKVQSDYSGVIVTKYGSLDFGETGLIEVPENVARYLSKLKGYKVV